MFRRARATRTAIGGGVLLASCAAVAGCSCASGPPAPAVALAWPEADRLFRDAPLWHGGDSAYSVDLGNGRVLWLFGDSFVGPVDAMGTRAASRMVRNTVGIQRGYDPSTATMTFYHGRTDDGPGPFFQGEGDRWLWPGPAVRFPSGPLLLTFALVANTDAGLGFETVSSRALLVDDPEAVPPAWTTRPVALPPQQLGVQLGAGALLAENRWLYAFAPVEPGDHDVFLARWRLSDAERGELGAPQWWGDGWSDDASDARAVVRDAQTEFTVHRAPDGLLWLVAVDGFGGANVTMRTAEWPWGPWSSRRLLLRPEVSDREGVLVYSAKAHPALAGADVVLTYCTNHVDLGTLVADTSLYFPRFARWAR